MKTSTLTLAAVVALLALAGTQPDPPSGAGETPTAIPAPAPVLESPGEQPEQDVPDPDRESSEHDVRPQVRMYAPSQCAVCRQLYGEIEGIGGYSSLPFDLVVLPLLDWMDSGPWFYWRDDGVPSGWRRMHGLQRVNGKRLDYLLREWLETQPVEDKPVPAQGHDGIGICCCAGSDTAVCLCIEEINAGIERGPCTCDAVWGSRHHMRGDTPVGPAGGYRQINQTVNR